MSQDAASLDGLEAEARRDHAGSMPTTGQGPRIALLFMLCWLVAGAAAWRTCGGSALGEVDPRLDPNTATWWQLSSLPHIGTGLAKDIVAFRTKNGVRPFHRAADLEQVPGIGAKTVQRLAKYLRFDDP